MILCILGPGYREGQGCCLSLGDVAGLHLLFPHGIIKAKECLGESTCGTSHDELHRIMEHMALRSFASVPHRGCEGFTLRGWAVHDQTSLPGDHRRS